MNSNDQPAQSAPPALRFSDFSLAGPLHAAVSAAGYAAPTPIQEAAIPRLLAGSDVLGCAQTGTGKTAAFALPILQNLLQSPRGRGPRAIQALVLAPTRELAAQIGDSFGRYAAGSDLRHLVVFGGVGREPQVRALRRGVDILIATPGRLLDLVSDGSARLDRARFVVLDEADRMLDMGFIHDIRRLMARVPSRRQTMLFSATLPVEIEALAAQFLNAPERIAVDPVSSTGEPIEQSVYFVAPTQKAPLLVELLQDGAIDRALVFTRTKHGANRLAQKLTRRGIPASAIHGNKSQSARERTLAGLRSGETRVVVATDLASRGLDVKGLSHVVNYDLPNEPESYVHRVGRTGRAGASGIAVSLCGPEEKAYLQAIERLTGRRLIRRSAADHGIETWDAPASGPSQTADRGPADHAAARARGKGTSASGPRRERRSRHRAARPDAVPADGSSARVGPRSRAQAPSAAENEGMAMQGPSGPARARNRRKRATRSARGRRRAARTSASQ